ncbi:DEAD/DEAH box helicase [marine bacterium AO1-C]|nr:DEAD/DEAH box helicase [marine bacterium AO1-C]
MVTFEEIGLRPEILQAVHALGFEKPTPIQEQAIPFVLSENTDLLAFAQTGTGKTAAFSLPMLERIDAELPQIQALVLCPTRELCLQIAQDIDNFTKFLKIRTTAVYGGASIDKQIDKLKRGAHIVVGTPGRTLDLIKRKRLKLEQIQWLVLDEADEMLNMGFKQELDSILATTPKEKQTLLFSATMPKELIRIAEQYMHEPKKITVGQRNTGAKNVSHEFYVVQARDRYQALKRITDINPNIYGIVFCRTRRETKEIANKLMQDGYNADALHGDLSQAQRDHVMSRFRSRHLQILVATDVAARGLDVDDISHVINFNLPDDLEVYIHRSGRTGRAGKTGVSLIITHSREIGRIKSIERKIGKTIERKKVPTSREICEKRLLHLMDKVKEVNVNDDEIAPYLPKVYEKLESLSREDLIKHFVSFEFNRFLEYYKDAPDLNVANKRERNGRDREREGERGGRDRKRRGRVDFNRYFINLGSKDELSPKNLLSFIDSHPKLKNVEVGKIDIQKSFSFFEIDKRYESQLIEAFAEVEYGGNEIVIERSKGGRGQGGGRRDSGRKSSYKGKRRS